MFVLQVLASPEKFQIKRSSETMILLVCLHYKKEATACHDSIYRLRQTTGQSSQKVVCSIRKDALLPTIETAYLQYTMTFSRLGPFILLLFACLKGAHLGIKSQIVFLLVS